MQPPAVPGASPPLASTRRGSARVLFRERETRTQKPRPARPGYRLGRPKTTGRSDQTGRSATAPTAVVKGLLQAGSGGVAAIFG